MQLKALRKNNGFSKQKEFAKAIGQKVSTVSMWETGRSIPKTTDLPRIAKALNVPVERVVECFTSETKKAE